MTESDFINIQDGEVNQVCYFIGAYADQSLDSGIVEKVRSKYGFMPNNADRCFGFPAISGAFCYRFTSDYCDCKTAFGCGKTSKTHDLDRAVEFFNALKNTGKLKHITLLKHWDDGSSPSELPKEVIHVDDLNSQFLLTIHDDVLYKIQLFKKYY